MGVALKKTVVLRTTNRPARNVLPGLRSRNNAGDVATKIAKSGAIDDR